eukprot:jgi/Chlat1/4182/Chrsp27S04280
MSARLARRQLELLRRPVAGVGSEAGGKRKRVRRGRRKLEETGQEQRSLEEGPKSSTLRQRNVEYLLKMQRLESEANQLLKQVLQVGVQSKQTLRDDDEDFL